MHSMNYVTQVGLFQFVTLTFHFPRAVYAYSEMQRLMLHFLGLSFFCVDYWHIRLNTSGNITDSGVFHKFV